MPCADAIPHDLIESSYKQMHVAKQFCTVQHLTWEVSRGWQMDLGMVLMHVLKPLTIMQSPLLTRKKLPECLVMPVSPENTS